MTEKYVAEAGRGRVRSRVFCMASAKGGSGKTVLSATFGSLLASMGKRVLLVDTDAATNGLSLFYLNSIVEALESTQETMYGVFEKLPEGRSVPNVIEIAPSLDLLPATYRFRNSEAMPIVEFARAIRRAVKRMRGRYDYVFLDAQAGSDEFAEVAMNQEISDRVVIVSEYDPMSAAGVERLKALFPASLEYQRMWILLNKMLPELVASFREFLEIARYLSPIPWDPEVVRAYSRRSLAVDLEEGNEYTAAVVQTLRSMLDGADRAALEAWLEQRNSAALEPIREQKAEAAKRLASLRASMAGRERRTTNVEVGAAVITGGIAVVSAVLSGAVANAFSEQAALVAASGGVVVTGIGLVVRWFSRKRLGGGEHGADVLLQSEVRELERQVARLSALEELEFTDRLRSVHRT